MCRPLAGPCCSCGSREASPLDPAKAWWNRRPERPGPAPVASKADADVLTWVACEGSVPCLRGRTPSSAHATAVILAPPEPLPDKTVRCPVPQATDNCAMRLLIIDDEVRLAEFLKKGLAEAGYVVDVAHDGIDGLHLAVEGTYDLIVLDVMLPGKDGFEVLSELRRLKRTPVLMLTARDSVADRVKGLVDGADDYLVKPFSFSELSARIQALLRRGGSDRDLQPLNALRLADLELDMARRKATRAGKKLDLTPKEFNLLVLFLQRRGQVLSRTVLAEQVWDINFDSDLNVVEVAVRRLRAKVDEPFPTRLIHTVRGMGYVLEERGE